MNKLGKAQDVAKRLGITEHSVWYATRLGNYATFAVKISANRYRYDMDALEDFIRTGGLFRDDCQVNNPVAVAA